MNEKVTFNDNMSVTRVNAFIDNLLQTTPVRRVLKEAKQADQDFQKSAQGIREAAKQHISEATKLYMSENNITNPSQLTPDSALTIIRNAVSMAVQRDSVKIGVSPELAGKIFEAIAEVPKDQFNYDDFSQNKDRRATGLFRSAGPVSQDVSDEPPMS